MLKFQPSPMYDIWRCRTEGHSRCYAAEHVSFEEVKATANKCDTTCTCWRHTIVNLADRLEPEVEGRTMNEGEYIAGDLTSEVIGMEAFLPAEADYDAHVWRHGWRRISMVSHTTKGVKIRCSKSGHVDHTLKVTDVVNIRPAQETS